jgi:hypothetical protein
LPWIFPSELAGGGTAGAAPRPPGCSASFGTGNTFKRQTGLTPTAYRAEHLGRGVALIPGCYALLWTGGFKPRDEAE